MNSNENLLRPTQFSDFFGQNNIIDQLKIYIYSSKKEKKVLDHILFYGPPGLGKTTLAKIISNELKSNFIKVNALTIEKPSTLISLLGQLQENDILFIDEIHKLKKDFIEILYSVMEDFVINITYENNENTKVLTLNVPPFTLIGATTNAGCLPTPLRDRFPLIFKFNYYSSKELVDIYVSKDKLFQLNIDQDCHYEIVNRSRNTPRCLINIMKKLYDFKVYNKLNKFTKSKLFEAFKVLKIHEYGLNEEDIEIMKIILEKYNNSPLSLETISSIMNEDISNIRNINEPFLVMNEILLRTKRGRMLSKKGIDIYYSIKDKT